MTTLFIISIIIWCIELIMQGLNFWTILSAIATILFMARKIGHFCSLNSLVTLEVVGGIVTVVFQILLSRFSIVEFLIVFVTRCVFLCVFLYDKYMYVYYTEKRRKDINNVDR